MMTAHEMRKNKFAMTMATQAINKERALIQSLLEFFIKEHQQLIPQLLDFLKDQDERKCSPITNAYKFINCIFNAQADRVIQSKSINDAITLFKRNNSSLMCEKTLETSCQNIIKASEYFDLPLELMIDAEVPDDINK